MHTIRLCQLNLLAPMWINKEYKVLPCYDLYVDPKRLNVTLAYLKDISADIYCLCEVEARQLDKIDEAFPNYHRMFTSNATRFWSEWTTPEVTTKGKTDNKEGKWIANGTCTLLNASVYDVMKHTYINLGLSKKKGDGDGCRCTLVQAIHKKSNYSILIATVHFDTEVKKFMEAFTLIEALEELQSRKHFDIVLISGDYNFTDISSFERVGYTELVKEKSDTTPLPQGMIDHTLLLTSHKDIDFIGQVLQLHPAERKNERSGSMKSKLRNTGISQGRNAKDILEDVCATVSGNGSDHYASVMEMRFH